MLSLVVVPAAIVLAGDAANCAGPWEIYVSDLEGGNVHRLTKNNAYDWTSAQSWQPSRH